jgi:hypothetical protein
MTISESLGWLKTLQSRHAELVNLRNQNSAVQRHRYGNDNVQEIQPQYNAKALDKRITLIAREIRLLDEAIKRANAQTVVQGYERRDEVLGELED